MRTPLFGGPMKIEQIHMHMNKKEWTFAHSLAVLLATVMDSEKLIPAGVSKEDTMDACVISAERSFIALREENEDKIPEVGEFIMTTVNFALQIMKGNIHVTRIESDDSDA